MGRTQDFDLIITNKIGFYGFFLYFSCFQLYNKHRAVKVSYKPDTPYYGPVMVRSIATKIGRCVLAGKHFEISCTQQIQLALQVAFSAFCNELEQNSQNSTF